jgi:hypothetical protein
MRILLFRFCITLIIITPIYLDAQSYAFGFKSGLTAGIQQWNIFGDDPLYKMPFIAFIETADNVKGSAYAELGYHVKGAANRPKGSVVYIDQNGNQVEYDPTTIEYKFYNLSLNLGFKRKYPSGSNFAYWLLGIRGDYTLGTNFKEFEEVNKYFFAYPDNKYVTKWNYGMTIGGGYEFPFSDFVSGIIEFTVNPDLSKQYRQPPFYNIPDPYVPGQTYNLAERQISNITLELTLGIRFLNKVEYID